MWVLRFQSIVLCIVLLCASITNGQLYQKEFFTNLKNTLDGNSEYSINSSLVQSRSYDNELCVQQFGDFLDGLGNGSFWAIQVADAWGKIPTGILQGNFYEFGSYDQCLKIDHIGTFKGQYCLAGVGLKIPADDVQKNVHSHQHTSLDGFTGELPTRMQSPGMTGPQFSIGLCIPDSCSPVFISKIIEQAIQSQINSPLSVMLSEQSCYENEHKELSGVEIFAIVFFSVIGILMLTSTIYDVVMTQLNNPKRDALIAFSVYTNGEKIFKCNRSKSANMMECINGIRVLSIVWVVFGHTYFTFLLTPTSNLAVMGKWLENPYSMLIMAGTVSVDSFFLLSGLLVAWSMLRHLDKNKGRINIPLLYFHRYLRLTPALAAAILLYVAVLKRVVNGPISNSIALDQSCDNYWWSTLLYVQNYVNPNEICVGHSWYLSVDMQLFILSPLIVWPMWRFKSKFLWIIPIVILLSMQCAFAVIIYNNGLEGGENMAKVYFPTHTRMGAWLVGILLGYFMHNFKQYNQQRIPLPVIIIGWTISIGSILAIIFGIYPMYQPTHVITLLERAFYDSFSRVSWAIALAWIIFACVNGYGGPVNWFLSLTFWQPLSRISYCLYIVHLIIQLTIMSMVKTPVNFSDMNAIHKFWGDFGLSLTAAFIWTLAFESPVLTLEKILLGKKSNANKPTEQTNGNTATISNETENHNKV